MQPENKRPRPSVYLAESGSLGLKDLSRVSQEKLLQLNYRGFPLLPSLQPDFQGGDDNEKIIDWQLPGGGAATVYRRSFRTLQPGEWLNDEVMNGYANVLNMKYYYNNTGASKCFVVSSWLLEKIAEPGGYDRVVQKWPRGIDIFALDKLLFLHNIGNAHWALVYVNIPGKRIEYIDSMGSKDKTKDKTVINWVWKYLKGVHKRDTSTVIEEGWTYYCYGSSTPQQQQRDGNNCGVYALVAADYILSDLPLSFSGLNMPDFRNKIAYCLLQKGDDGVTLSELCNKSKCSVPSFFESMM